MNFSERFADLLGKSDLSQKGFADLAGISQGAIVHYKKGRVPKSDELFRIAQVFGVTMEWLLTGEGPKTLGDAHGAVLKRVASDATSQEDFDQRLAEITPLVDEINTLRESLRKIEAEAKRIVDESGKRMRKTSPRRYDFEKHEQRLVAEE